MNSHILKNINGNFSLDYIAIDPLYLWYIFLKYRKIFLLLPFVLSLIIYLIFKSFPNIYQSTATIILSPNNQNIVSIDQVYDEKISSNNSNLINTQIEILKSKIILSKVLIDQSVISEFDNINYKINNKLSNFLINIFKVNAEVNSNPHQIIENIIESFDIKSSKDNNVIYLSLTSKFKDLNPIILNAIIDQYLKYDIDQKISITTYANKKITERLSELKKNLESSESKLHTYKQDNKLIDLGDIKNLKSEEIKTISKNIVKTEQEIQKLENDIIQVKTAGTDLDTLLSLEIIKEDKEVQNIKNNLDSNINNIDSLKLVYQTSHPKVQKALKINENLEIQLSNYIDDTISSKLYELSNLQSFLSSSKDKLEHSRFELQELELQDLEMQKYIREVKLNESIYQIFLERLKETNEAKELQTSNAKVLDSPSSSPIPISPHPVRNSLLGYLISFFVLMFIASYYEIFRKSINSAEPLDQNGLSSIGVLPKLSEEELMTTNPIHYYSTNNNSTFTEAIKMLNVLLISKFNESRIFLFSSPVAGEGKTTVSFNFALSLAEKSKVIYLEMDFKRPSLKKIFKLDGTPGFKDLANNTAKFQDTILNFPGSNLDIISAGSDSNFKIHENKIKSFIQILKENYDYIIIDSAPILPIVDTLQISKYVDVTLLVARAGFTKLSGLLVAQKRINQISECHFATILNYFDTTTMNYYDYSQYGSYYNYAYNYNSQA